MLEIFKARAIAAMVEYLVHLFERGMRKMWACGLLWAASVIKSKCANPNTIANLA